MSTTETGSPDPWRDELTPRSRASRRRWTLVLAALLVALGLTATSDRVHDLVLRDGPGGRAILFLILLATVFGLLRRGTRRLGALRDRDDRLDERDLAARHRAFRTAFGLFLLVVVVTLYLLPSALPDVRRTVDGVRVSSDVLSYDEIYPLMAWFLAWALFLPTAALAWREPDAPAPDEEDGEAHPVLGEWRRDLLLVVTFAVGGAASAAYPDNNAGPELVVGLLPFALVICAVGVLRRRREGFSWLRSGLGVWRIAAAVALIVVLLAAVGGFAVSDDSSDTTERADAGEHYAPGKPGVFHVTQLDAADEEYECLLVNSPKGRALEGRAARREARRLGEDPKQICDEP